MGIPKDRQKGMITVEGVLCLVPFIMVILGIISLINVFVVHNRIQYAMQEIGSELTSYTYFYQVLGLRDADNAIKNDFAGEAAELKDTIGQISDFMTNLESVQSGAALVKDDVTGVVTAGSIDDFTGSLNRIQDDVSELRENVDQTVENGKDLVDTGKRYISDPKELLNQILALGIEKGSEILKTEMLELISSSLMRVYLDMSFAESQPLSADEYLRFFGVKDGMEGLDFSRSHLFSWDGEDETENVRSKIIDIVVEYKIEIHVLKLFLKDPTITVVQRCAMPAWLDGDGLSYEGE